MSPPKNLKKILPLVIFAVFYLWSLYESKQVATSDARPQKQQNEPYIVSLRDADLVLAEAFKNHQSDIQVMGHGTVDRVLPDDNEGSRHQRFILKLDSGQTLVVAHNIDVAAKIEELSVGDRVDFYGEYEWNSQGGVLHWTHRASDGNHPGGWLKHDGRRYE